MALYRVKTRWSGFSGAPGYTILHFDAAVSGNVDGAENAATGTRAFFNSISALLPSAVRLDVEPAVELIEESSGELVDVFTVPTPAVLSGTQTGGFSSATGACVTWSTVGVRNGRRVKGRTFLVPLAGSQYEADGTLTSASINTLTTAAQALIAHTSDLHVFGRPSASGATDGASYTVTSARVTDKTAILRSRRD